LKAQLAGYKKNKEQLQIEKVSTSSPEEYIEVLKLEVDTAKSDYEYVKSIYDAQKNLYDSGAISKIELSNAENTCIKAKASLDGLQLKYNQSSLELADLKSIGIDGSNLNSKFSEGQDGDLDVAIKTVEFKINALQSKLNNDYSGDAVKRLKALIEVENTSISQLNEQIRDCTVIATSTGYITNCPVKNLSSVEQGQIVATIKSENMYTVSVDVLTNSVSYLKVGDKVQLTQKLRGEDYIFSGSIKEIYNYATESYSALGLKEHRVKVLVDVFDDKSVLMDGYEIDVKFEIYAEENKISVPNSALYVKNEQNYVFKKQNSKAVLTPVEIGHKTNTQTVINSGLTDNDIIVYNVNTEGLSDGTRISAKK